MAPNLEGLKFETACGTYRIRYVVKPHKDFDRKRWEYWLLFKWMDPHDENNKATPEFRLRVDLLEEDILAHSAEAELKEALRMWIEGAPYCDDPKLSFRSGSTVLKERTDA